MNKSDFKKVSYAGIGCCDLCGKELRSKAWKYLDNTTCTQRCMTELLEIEAAELITDFEMEEITGRIRWSEPQ